MLAILEINMDNDAFEQNPGAELGRILRELAAKVESADLGDGFMQAAVDRNDNRVGELWVEG